MAMMYSLPLLIHNVGYLFCAVLLISLIILIYVKDHKSRANQFLILGFIGVLFFVIPHLIGVNVTDPHLSQMIFMFNVSGLFMSCFFAHFIFIFLGKEKEQKPALIVFYILSTVLFIIYVIFPETFLLPSVPKLYFPNYYVAGSLHWVYRLLSNFFIPAYFLIYMMREYPHRDPVMKNRMKYLFVAVFLGFFCGGLAIPLVFTPHPVIFGILIDPIYSILFVPFFAIPFTYAILKYDLLDIRIIAKRAFVYAISVAVVGFLITLLDSSNTIAHEMWAGFPDWAIPFISAVIVVSISFSVWRRLRESDLLKYEFITVVTHKFRTPLTQIRWAVETLGTDVLPAGQQSVDQIKNANYRLIELTNLLVRLSDNDTNEYEMHSQPFNIIQLVTDAVPEYIERARVANVTMTYTPPAPTPLAPVEPVIVNGDETRIKFVIQILLDNAINYNHEGGKAHVSFVEDVNKDLKKDVNKSAEKSTENSFVTLAVSDTGIGLSKEEFGRLFQKFWRSPLALKADTEGMGIGLFMAKNIVERQGGKLWAESNGLDKGATFYLKLPIKS